MEVARHEWRATFFVGDAGLKPRRIFVGAAVYFLLPAPEKYWRSIPCGARCRDESEWTLHAGGQLRRCHHLRHNATVYMLEGCPASFLWWLFRG